MTHSDSTTVLFTGYAPVHFVCFQPIYQRLIQRPEFNVFLSGGLRTKTDSGYLYDERGLYDSFGVPEESLLSVDEIRKRDFDVLFAANTKFISPKTAKTRVQMFHGISFRNRAIRAANMNCDYYFLVGPYMHRKFVEAELLAQDDPRALKIGFPKTDRLVNGDLNREDQLGRYGLDGSRPVIVYAPTGEKHNSLETMGEEVIRRLRESNRFDLLIKLHDHPKNKAIDWCSRLETMENEHTKVVRGFDVVPLLYLADLLITDASSVSSEYSLLDRPIVFLDVPKLIARMMERKASMLDMDTWGRHAGVVVRKADTIVDIVESRLADSAHQSDVRRSMAKDLFYNPGSATDVAIAWMSERFAGCPSETVLASKTGGHQG
ncbi:MAG: CDP-glycerol glycerophosphotransferase family protein [Planctomycetes bacterium]|nr:CDP-glycerol glycerophosphotransferase family protein [Planctomycetota bacterium]